uniref:Uncharacterized protein n=1 Tax=Panagrolaimus davidi TaxID=227884 RepID=A0A914NZM3_9BILA
MGICLCVNNSKLQPLTYRLIATTPPRTTPMEVIVEQEPQVITTTTTGTAPLEEKGIQRKNSDKSLAKTKSATATATASAATPKKDNSK